MISPWYQSHSNTKLPELDLESSPTTVYERKDFVEEEVPERPEDPESGTRTQWTYMERTWSREEYFLVHALTEGLVQKHDDDVIDTYTEFLIEEGLL